MQLLIAAAQGCAEHQLGGRLGLMAIPLLALLTLDASTLEVSLLRTSETAAWLVLGLFAGAWGDRVRCPPVLIAADLGRAVLFGSSPAAAAFGVLGLPQLYVVLALGGLLTVLVQWLSAAVTLGLKSARGCATCSGIRCCGRSR